MSATNSEQDSNSKVLLKNDASLPEFYKKSGSICQSDNIRNYINQGLQNSKLITSHAFDPADNSPAANYNYQNYGVLSSTNAGSMSPAISSMNSFGLGNNIYNSANNNFLYSQMNSTNGAQGRYVSDSPEGFSNSNRYFGGINEPRSEGADKEYMYNSNFGGSMNALNTPHIFDGSVRAIHNFDEGTENQHTTWNLETVPEPTPFVSNSLVRDSSATNKENASDHENDCTPGAVANSSSSTLCSKGSSGHPLLCRPCAFFWTKGCMNGKDCRFCHEWHPPKKKKPMKEQKNLMIIARPDGRIEFMRCTVQEALGVL